MIEISTSVHRAPRTARDGAARPARRARAGGRAAGPGDRRRRRASVPALVRAPDLSTSRASSHVAGLYGYLAKQFTVFGQHVHIGVRDGDAGAASAAFAGALRAALHRAGGLFARTTRASTPHSTRSRLNPVSLPAVGAGAVRARSGRVRGYFDSMRELGIVESMKDFYWDIRPEARIRHDRSARVRHAAHGRARSDARGLRAGGMRLAHDAGTAEPARTSTWPTPTTASRHAASASRAS